MAPRLPAVSRYWAIDGADLINLTQVEVYRDALAQAETASARARAGAQARWQAHREHSSRNAQASLVECPPSLSPKEVHPPTPSTEGDAQAFRASITREERKWPKGIRSDHHGCPHTPDRCEDEYTCLGRLVGEKRHAERGGLRAGVS
jgi:hypothetical protein